MSQSLRAILAVQKSQRRLNLRAQVMSGLASSGQSSARTYDRPQFQEFDSLQPSVIILKDANTSIRANFRPSNYKDPAKNDWQKLSMALGELLTEPGMPEVKNENAPRSILKLSKWELDAPGDAIIRFVEVGNEDIVNEIIEKIGKVADEFNHHPSIKNKPSGNETRKAWYLSVTCRTHRPPGLSMKDINLARKVNEILSLYHGPCKEALTLRE